MSKACDQLEWDFFVATLSSMYFPRPLVELIHGCISSVSYKILINGQARKSFTSERGLWQVDPLSPYLFILCANVFLRMLKQEVVNGGIHGIKVAWCAPVISHLFFSWTIAYCLLEKMLWRLGESFPSFKDTKPL